MAEEAFRRFFRDPKQTWAFAAFALVAALWGCGGVDEDRIRAAAHVLSLAQAEQVTPAADRVVQYGKRQGDVTEVLALPEYGVSLRREIEK